MTLADVSMLLEDTTKKLTTAPAPQAGASLIDQWAAALQDNETTTPLADTLMELKAQLPSGDAAVIQPILKTLAEQVSELSTKMGAEGEMPSLLEGLATAIRSVGEGSRADAAGM